MPARFPIDPARFTVILTSCGRFDLLEETIRSFVTYFSVHQLIVAEDSGDHAGAAAIAGKFPFVDMRVNDPRLGQMASIDKAYAGVETPFVLHLEDDWRFHQGCNLDHVATILESSPRLSLVTIANRRYAMKYGRSARISETGGLRLREFEPEAHPDWFGYSFNPSVVRIARWNELGPFANYRTEGELSRMAKLCGLGIAMHVPAIAEHTGDSRHVPDPFQPLRPRRFVQKLNRSIRKRYATLCRLFGVNRSA